MYNIGLIGVESKHAVFFGEIINKNNRYEGYRIASLWGGDAPGRIPEMQNSLGIDIICDTYRELADRSDAVMVIQRRGSDHFLPAKTAIEIGKPVFVDKPFTSDPGEAQVLAELARTKRVPLTGGTTLKFLPEIIEIKELIAKENPDTVIIRYYADASSEYDGFNFYGSHLAELCVSICGEMFSEVKAVKNGDGILACVSYPAVKAVINSTPGFYGLEITLLGQKTRRFCIDETECYRRGMDAFINMLKSGVPPADYSHYTASVQLTADIIKSYNNQ